MSHSYTGRLECMKMKWAEDAEIYAALATAELGPGEGLVSLLPIRLSSCSFHVILLSTNANAYARATHEVLQ